VTLKAEDIVVGLQVEGKVVRCASTFALERLVAVTVARKKRESEEKERRRPSNPSSAFFDTLLRLGKKSAAVDVERRENPRPPFDPLVFNLLSPRAPRRLLSPRRPVTDSIETGH
jgi:hypothetical protein